MPSAKKDAVAKARRTAGAALKDHLSSDRDRRRLRDTLAAANTVDAVRQAAARVALSTRWCESRPSREQLRAMSKLLGKSSSSGRVPRCEELVRMVARAASSSTPEDLVGASALTQRVLAKTNPVSDPAFAKLPESLRHDLDRAYRKLALSLEKLLAERNQEDTDLGREAEAFLRCVERAKPGRLEEDCCGLLPAFSHCQKRLQEIDRLALEAEQELPAAQGLRLGHKIGLFAAGLVAASLLVGAAQYMGWLPAVMADPLARAAAAARAAPGAAREWLSGFQNWGWRGGGAAAAAAGAAQSDAPSSSATTPPHAAQPMSPRYEPWYSSLYLHPHSLPEDQPKEPLPEQSTGGTWREWLPSLPQWNWGEGGGAAAVEPGNFSSRLHRRRAAEKANSPNPNGHRFLVDREGVARIEEPFFQTLGSAAGKTLTSAGKTLGQSFQQLSGFLWKTGERGLGEESGSGNNIIPHINFENDTPLYHPLLHFAHNNVTNASTGYTR